MSVKRNEPIYTNFTINETALQAVLNFIFVDLFKFL